MAIISSRPRRPPVGLSIAGGLASLAKGFLAGRAAKSAERDKQAKIDEANRHNRMMEEQKAEENVHRAGAERDLQDYRAQSLSQAAQREADLQDYRNRSLAKSGQPKPMSPGEKARLDLATRSENFRESHYHEPGSSAPPDPAQLDYWVNGIDQATSLEGMPGMLGRLLKDAIDNPTSTGATKYADAINGAGIPKAVIQHPRFQDSIQRALQKLAPSDAQVRQPGFWDGLRAKILGVPTGAPEDQSQSGDEKWLTD